MTGRIVIVGDVMIDRTWLVDVIGADSTSSAHFGVRPQALVEPDRRTDVLGAPAAVMRWVLAISKHHVALSGAWSDEIELALNAKKGLLSSETPLLPEYQADRARECRVIRLCSIPFDTVKWRVYALNAEGKPAFDRRFDRDPHLDRCGKDACLGELVLDRLGSAVHTADVVVVGDFNKGLLRESTVVNAVNSATKHVLLRAKNPASVKEVKWTLWMCSLRDLFRFAFRKPSERPPEPIRAIKPGPDVCRVHPDVLPAARLALKETDRPEACVYVHLEGEGGILVSRGKVTVHALPEWLRKKPGVSARDCFLAHLAVKLVDNASTVDDAARYALAASVTYSQEAHSIRYDRLADNGKWYVPAEIPQVADDWTAKVKRVKAFVDIQPGNNAGDDGCADPLDPSVKKVFLRDAEFYLPGYLTVNATHGHEIAKVAGAIRGYRERPSGKPLVIALGAEPGSGKSHLVRALANATTLDQASGKIGGTDLIEERVDAWSSIEDLYDLCERIRTVALGGRTPFVFLDEIDTEALHGQPVYARLLAPLGDGAYYRGGHPHRLGPVVFVLAGSSPDWRKAVGWPKLKKVPKGWPAKLPDLMSRVGPKVVIPKWDARPADAAYLALRFIRRRWPDVWKVSRKKLKSLAGVGDARAIEDAVAKCRRNEVEAKTDHIEVAP